MKHFTIVPCTTITLIFLSIILRSSYLAEAKMSSRVSLTDHGDNGSQWPCPDVQFCSDVANCCQLGVDEYGWIAAAVGWSLWFLTLILLCVAKIMKLSPDEPKYLQA
ncbi:transmembrane protein 213 [Gopherus flavomarginatus]|uniref:transmembrane protein 213 n=1 Tax=Gopherus flavomarginatus TaxID=286002 RepID=UPI0021CC0616|nr:transmembrane protein 213 [Gopherus flavomarginatus]